MKKDGVRFEALEAETMPVIDEAESELPDSARAQSMEQALRPRPPFAEGVVVVARDKRQVELVVLSSSLDMAQVYDGSGVDPKRRIGWRWTDELEAISGPSERTVQIARSARKLGYTALA